MMLVPGMRIGAYTVRSFLGNGSGSFAYEVETELGGRYALKMSRSVVGESPSLAWEMDQRFTRNIVCLEQLQDVRWVARIIAHDRYPDPQLGRQYLVQELVPPPPGRRRPESIVDWARRTSPSIRKLLTVFMQLADACEDMREAGIQNRDLKPANILMTPDGEPRLIDFNSAIWHRAALLTWPSARYIPTSPAYMPPEMARIRLREKETGREEPFLWTPAADLHALGVVFYKVLTGEHPFDLSPQELLTQIAYVQPMRPMDLQPVPFGLSKVVMRLLAKDPEERYQEGGELRDDLQALSRIADASWDAPYEVPRTDRHEHGDGDGASLPEPDTGEVDTAEPREPTSSQSPGSAIVSAQPAPAPARVMPVQLLMGRPDRRRLRRSVVAALLLAGIGAGSGLRAVLSPSSPPVEEPFSEAPSPPVKKTIYRARRAAAPRAVPARTDDDLEWLASCPDDARETVHTLGLYAGSPDDEGLIVLVPPQEPPVLEEEPIEAPALMYPHRHFGTLIGKVIAGADRTRFRFTGLRLPNGRTFPICGIAANRSVDSAERLRVRLAPYVPRAG